MGRAVMLGAPLTAWVLLASAAHAVAPPERAAAVIETFLQWALEGRSVPADPPVAPEAFPHRSCGGRLDPQHLPATVYVSWQLSAEGQHAACNWKYDVVSHRATPLTPAEAAEVEQRITSGRIGPQERAFFHAAPRGDGSLAVTAGYCWGSATATLAFPAGSPVVVGALAIHGY